MTCEWDDDNGVLRRYLLGSAPASERERLEQALFADEGLYEELLATEDELIDEYLGGRLPESQRASFLQYLSALPDCRQKLAFAEALRSRSLASLTESAPADEITPPEHFRVRVPAFVLAAAAVFLVLLGGIWSLVTISGLREEVESVQAELRSQERQDDLQGQRARALESGVSSGPVVRSFLLAAGTLRGGGSRQVVPVIREPELLELRLDMGSDDYPTYRAAVHDANARELMSRSQLRARTQEDRILVVFNASSDLFTPGDYYISLSGEGESRELEPVARYDFRVSRE